MTVNSQQSTVNDHRECLYTLDAHQLTSSQVCCFAIAIFIFKPPKTQKII
ncbi:hypothetical protein LC607_13220 [Nostoc sp. CHAB 5824]|nr:hypothetical protein [Nostoc sp. CHAB 5824]